MARRRKNNVADLIELIGKLAGVLFLLSLLFPSVRNFISALGVLAVSGVAILILVCLILFIFRIFQRIRNPEAGADQKMHVSAPNSGPPSKFQVSSTQFAAQLRAIDWYQFEKLVALMYEKQGCQVTRRGGANPDGGIDLIIEKNGITAAIQCKQWKTWNVGVKAVREFLGALIDAQIQHGIFITLNGYTGDAKLLAEKHGIKLINETGLIAMLDGLQIQTDSRVLEILNDSRKFCPKCERLMVERVAGKGPNPGQRFWGCSGYPECRFTMPM